MLIVQRPMLRLEYGMINYLAFLCTKQVGTQEIAVQQVVSFVSLENPKKEVKAAVKVRNNPSAIAICCVSMRSILC